MYIFSDRYVKSIVLIETTYSYNINKNKINESKFTKKIKKSVIISKFSPEYHELYLF